jgi:hypothetical protein
MWGFAYTFTTGQFISESPLPFTDCNNSSYFLNTFSSVIMIMLKTAQLYILKIGIL